eukprot:CAMPEP_0203751784 /NCGR_PEP_ID=MMETSP0098-20131031/5800_1 /ASSEMBLY_ACC=CAM_ASM_000208 /TAXON_ID=96639 /ORGANISM=" , Strain NY0313808BC1" /LENGTH=326 /DNA_ID=CAMNT_0050641669 /DNA_START=161 /DNA_END=1141 /DNA_ORIENTATION=-
MDDMKTTTNACASKSFENDRIWLNGEEQDVASNKRLVNVFREIRKRAKVEWKDDKVHVVSTNSFPTAAGLASSAAGYACLVKCLASLFKVEEAYPNELTAICRMGSGSASRSLYGGFNAWDMGVKEDGTDSIARHIKSESEWNLSALICVVSAAKKGVSSTSGMQDSVRTSPFLTYRAKELVPLRMKEMEEAINNKDFTKFANITMKDSNNFHSTCLDTVPPIRYMNDTSYQVISLVHELNKAHDEPICCYTFDAGPNAVLFMEKKNIQTVLDRILREFPGTGVQGQTTIEASQPSPLNYIIHTNTGRGAREVPCTLIDTNTGLPL